MKLFNDSLTTRLDTLERNIKSKSNSFYDSYLDLLEATIKYILDENNISYDDSRTCGYLVKEESIKNYLVNELKLDDYTYNKLPDYIKKCNDHKHKKEKTLGIESIINYLRVYYNLVNYYLSYIKAINIEFDANYYSSIYGETERLNNEYREEVLRLRDELKDSIESNKLSEQDLEQYKSLLSIKDIELLNLDEQNQQLQAQISILKDIKLNSMEEKLNKALELLMNLSESVVENRAVSIALGETIIGKDITTTEYMDKAKKSIELKNQNLFEKIDNNASELLKLNNKFNKLELEDLCNLAKRTYEAKDFEGAKRLYNQVLLLNPNDWRAEYYVTALNLYGSNFHDDIAFTLEFRDKLYANTIENILNLKDNDKIRDFTDMFEMIDKDIDASIKHVVEQFENHQKYVADHRSIFKKEKDLPDYLKNDVYVNAYYGVQKALFIIYNSIKRMPIEFENKKVFYANKYVEYMNSLKLRICKDISNDELNELLKIANKNLSYDYSWREQ